MSGLSSARITSIGSRRPLPSTAIPQLRSLVLVAIIFLYFPLPPQALLVLGWHYIGGGSEIEKIHPATYLLFAAFSLSLVNDQQFRSRVVARVATDPALLAFISAVTVTAAYCCFVRGASASPFIDTFFVAIMTTIIVTCIPIESIAFLRRLIDVFFLLNIAMIFWESAAHTTFFPSYLIGISSPSEIPTNMRELEAANFFARPCGLFGHPLNAALLLGVYCISTLAAMTARLSMGTIARLIMVILSYAAIFSTASRSSMVATTIALGAYFVYSAIRSGMTGHINRVAVGFAFTTVAFVVPVCLVLLSIGFFDAMLDRFQFDYGSALSRDYALALLDRASASDLWFGLPQQTVLGLQEAYGLPQIEISWVNFILVGGIVTAFPLFVTYFLFLFRSVRLYCAFGIYFASFVIFVATAASNGIWSKDTGLAMALAVGISFLRRDVSLGTANWSGDMALVQHRPN
jgi:hypothetical protein